MMTEWNHKYAVCNYCVNAIAQNYDCIYCNKKKCVITGKAITNGRSCKDFDFCSLSACNPDKEYKPNKKHTFQGQIKFEI